LQTILVVDDEAPIVDAISYNLAKEGFNVDSAADADECLSRIALNKPDLIVLDVMLPSGSGLDICKRLRGEDVTIPVILLTARAAESDTLRGFEVGADDYVTKPFRMRELMARIHALLRRSAEIVTDGSDEKGQAPQTEIVKLSVDGSTILIDGGRRDVSKN
jgi:DNA-binding response OmpR family regulator